VFNSLCLANRFKLDIAKRIDNAHKHLSSWRVPVEYGCIGFRAIINLLLAANLIIVLFGAYIPGAMIVLIRWVSDSESNCKHLTNLILFRSVYRKIKFLFVKRQEKFKRVSTASDQQVLQAPVFEVRCLVTYVCRTET